MGCVHGAELKSPSNRNDTLVNEKMYQYYLLYHTIIGCVAKERVPWSVQVFHDLTPAMTEKVHQPSGRWSDLQKERKRPLRNIVTEGNLACNFH